jgi:hypothetical protein
MTEELGSDIDAYHALEDVGHRARVLVPYPSHETAYEQDVIGSLLVAGVQVRFLRQPYVHAKLIPAIRARQQCRLDPRRTIECAWSNVRRHYRSYSLSRSRPFT